jgi:hypothetical protein
MNVISEQDLMEMDEFLDSFTVEQFEQLLSQHFELDELMFTEEELKALNAIVL